MQRRYLSLRYPLDRLLAALLLVAVSPLLVAVAVAVRVTSGRPVLFMQERVGRDGKVFTIVKFRTMVQDAETIGGGYFAKEHGSLLTPLGRSLRATSLDELPQLFNIVRGEMAIVGPRPSLVEQYERYTRFQRRRLEVLPGVTGLAQVTYRNDAPWSKRIVLDVEYVDRANPVLDIVILVRTLRNVVIRAGVREDQTRGQVDDLG